LVQFRSLYNDPNNRQILDIVDTPTGQVTIFEPSVEDINAIMQLKDMVDAFNQTSEGDNQLDITGATILKELIPRLTDLEMAPDMSDEEVAKIIAHPTKELEKITTILAGVVTDVYALMILNFRNNMTLQKIVSETEAVSDSTLAMYIANQSKTDEGRQQIAEINKQSNKVIQMQEAIKQAEKAEKEQNAKEDNSEKENSQTSVDKAE